jgi:hypothetical protein
MRYQKITLTDNEAELLLGLVGEMLEDTSGAADWQRTLFDSIYQKIDDLSEVT